MINMEEANQTALKLKKIINSTKYDFDNKIYFVAGVIVTVLIYRAIYNIKNFSKLGFVKMFINLIIIACLLAGFYHVLTKEKIKNTTCTILPRIFTKHLCKLYS